MKRCTIEDVMTREVVRADCDTPFKTVARMLSDNRISGLPVVDDEEKVVGVISETDLMHHQMQSDPEQDHRRLHPPPLTRSARTAAAKARARTARQLMTRPAVTVAPEQYLTEAAQIMRRHDVQQLPVVDEKDRLVGIVTRGDLLRVFLRPDDEIRRDVADRIAAGLCQPRYLVDVAVDNGVVTVKGHAERRSDVALALGIADRVDGVVSVTDRLSFQVDDTRPSPSSGPTGHM